MAASNREDESLSTSSCFSTEYRAGDKASDWAEAEQRANGKCSSLELVEDKLKSARLELASRKDIFRSPPWKNYVCVEVFKADNYNQRLDRGTAFLTGLPRVEGGVEYSTFLTAGHLLFEYDRVVLKPSLELLKDGIPLEEVQILIDIRLQNDRKRGFFECSSAYNGKADKLTSHDYGGIFVPTRHLEMEMEILGMSLDHPFAVPALPIPNPHKDKPIFVAGYPCEDVQNDQWAYLLSCDGKYLPIDPSLDQSVPESGKSIQQQVVDVHTAQPARGMSGSPVVLGDCPTIHEPTPDWTAIAIHVGKIRVDEIDKVLSSNVPEDIRSRSGVGLAVPITQALIEDLKISNTLSDDLRKMLQDVNLMTVVNVFLSESLLQWEEAEACRSEHTPVTRRRKLINIVDKKPAHVRQRMLNVLQDNNKAEEKCVDSGQSSTANEQERIQQLLTTPGDEDDPARPSDQVLPSPDQVRPAEPVSHLKRDRNYLALVDQKREQRRLLDGDDGSHEKRDCMYKDDLSGNQHRPQDYLEPSEHTAEAIGKALDLNRKEMSEEFLRRILPTCLGHQDTQSAGKEDCDILKREFSQFPDLQESIDGMRPSQDEAKKTAKPFIEDLLARCSEFAFIAFANILADAGYPTLSANLVLSFLDFMATEEVQARPASCDLERDYGRRLKLHRKIHQYSIADKSCFWANVFQRYFNNHRIKVTYDIPIAFLRQNKQLAKAEIRGETVNCNVCLFALEQNEDCPDTTAPALHWFESQKQLSVVTYSSLLNSVKRLTFLLLDSDQKIRTVLLHLPQDSPELVTAILACANYGAAFWPVSIQTAEKDLRKKLWQSKASLVITSEREGYAKMMMKVIEQYNNEVEEKNDHVKLCLMVEDSNRSSPAYAAYPPSTRESLKACKLLYYHEMLPEKNRVKHALLLQVDPDTPFVLTNTSGRLATSDVVQHQALNYLLMAAASAMYLSGLTRGSASHHVVVSTLGYSSLFSLTYGLIGPLLAGASVFLVDASDCQSKLDDAWEMIIQPNKCCTPSVLVTNPKQLLKFASYWERCSDAVKRLDHLRKIFCGHNAFSVNIKDDICNSKGVQRFLDKNNQVSLVIFCGPEEYANSFMSTATVPFCPPPRRGNHHHKTLLPMPGVAYKVEKGESSTDKTAAHPGKTHGELVLPKPWPAMMTTDVANSSSDSGGKSSRQFTVNGACRTGEDVSVDSDGLVSIICGSDDIPTGPIAQLSLSSVEEDLKKVGGYRECMLVREDDSGPVWALVAPPSAKRISTDQEARQLEKKLRGCDSSTGQRLFHHLIEVESHELDPLRLPDGGLCHDLFREFLALKGNQPNIAQLKLQFPRLQDVVRQVGQISKILSKNSFQIGISNF